MENVVESQIKAFNPKTHGPVQIIPPNKDPLSRQLTQESSQRFLNPSSVTMSQASAFNHSLGKGRGKPLMRQELGILRKRPHGEVKQSQRDGVNCIEIDADEANKRLKSDP